MEKTDRMLRVGRGDARTLCWSSEFLQPDWVATRATFHIQMGHVKIAGPAQPEEYVVRQIDGRQLIRNLTQPLAVRVLGGKEKDLPARIRKELPKRPRPRRPEAARARDLFAADLLAAGSGRLDLPQDQREKELLVLGERGSV